MECDLIMLLKKFLSYEKTRNGYLIHGDNADVMLVFMTDDVIRIRVSFAREFIENSYALVVTAWDDNLDSLFSEERTRITALDAACHEDDKSLTFTTKTLRLVMRKEPVAFTLYDSQGKIIYRDLQERAYERDHLGRLAHYSCMDRERDHFYGFGEKTGHLDKKGRRLRMSPKDAIGHDPEFGDPMYKHIPFYIRLNEENLHPLGLFYNNSYDCVFDMGQEISGYWERYCYYQVDGGDIDLFLINGSNIKEIIDRYTWLTGRTILPTKQSLGYCASTMYYAELERDCDQEIYRVIDKHVKEKIYIDNFWLASGYSSGEKDNLRYTFNWNHRRFPNPEEFFANMNARGINVICNLKPGVLKNHPYAEFYERNNAFIKTPDGQGDYYGRWWGGEGRFIDFTGIAGRDSWRELLEVNILSKGTKTVWNDNCEMDGIEDREAHCDNNGHGGTMAELKIIHSNMMAFTAIQAIKNVYPNERPYVINRAGFAGIQRYAQVWGGDNLTDWRTLKFNVATIMGMGLSGCANMGCDIGGFAGGAPESELLLRWIQNGIFQPRFVLNSANSDNTVTQPFMYEEILELVRDAFALRYKMLPFMYSLMYEASVSGLPVMRPLFLEFPHDKKCYSDNNLCFMFGASILVANVLNKGETTRRIYLPEGSNWYDMNDNFRCYQGGQTINLPVNLSSIPMFMRGNAVFITSNDIKNITHDKLTQLDLIITADSDSKFIFYDDDGHTQDYKKGVYSRVNISVKSGDRTTIKFTHEGSYESTIERMTLKLISKRKGAYWVSVDGVRLPRFIVRDNFQESPQGWYYNLSDRTICVKCSWPVHEVIISTEKFDLIGMNE
ncbi:MAG: DUF4968 domain-containing protein [Synergistaceae bacterium]|nr:DUF4968 domain-containing protein [Synergistaceae bacterium]